MVQGKKTQKNQESYELISFYSYNSRFLFPCFKSFHKHKYQTFPGYKDLLHFFVLRDGKVNIFWVLDVWLYILRLHFGLKDILMSIFMLFFAISKTRQRDDLLTKSSCTTGCFWYLFSQKLGVFNSA